MSGNSNSGRKPKYLTIKLWEEWKRNDWYHLKGEVAENKWLLRVFLASFIAWALIDRLIG